MGSDERLRLGLLVLLCFFFLFLFTVQYFVAERLFWASAFEWGGLRKEGLVGGDGGFVGVRFVIDIDIDKDGVVSVKLHIC